MGEAIARAVQRFSEDHPTLAPPHIRETYGGLSGLNRAQCIEKIKAGGCILCQERHDGGYKNCPILAVGHAGHGPATAWLKMYNEHRKANGATAMDTD